MSNLIITEHAIIPRDLVKAVTVNVPLQNTFLLE